MKNKSVLIRTLTTYYTGTVIKVTKSWFYLKDSAWILDTGRFSDCLHKGTLSEVEPIPGVTMLNRQNIVDVLEWNHPLPREQK